jgi:hypothetical protein
VAVVVVLELVDRYVVVFRYRGRLRAVEAPRA